MKIEIKHRFNSSVLFSTETANLKLAIKAAVRQGANLKGADLRGAYLRGAYLGGAYLGGAKYGEGVSLTIEPLQILGLHWPVFIFDEHIKIGCRLHPTEEWEAFEDRQIKAMDPHALEFWNKHKELIMVAAKLHSKKALAARPQAQETTEKESDNGEPK